MRNDAKAVNKTDSKNYKVYRHTTPNGRVYVGSTSQPPRKRWANGGGYANNPPFYDAIQRYGWENIKHEVMATRLTKEQAAEYEAELISYHHSDNPERGFNRSSSGQGFKGGRHTEESRARMIEGHKRHKQRGAVYVAKINGCNMAVYSTIAKAAKLTGTDPANISKAARGKRKTAGGYEWQLGTRHNVRG